MSITVNNLTFAYPHGDTILDDISFTAQSGQVTVLLGSNGVGKSTLLKNIAGILKGKGEILLGNTPPDAMTRSERMKVLAYMTQEEGSDTDLEVMDVVLLGLLDRIGSHVEPEYLEAAGRILDLLGIENLQYRAYGSLSGGQKRLVDCAQTLVRYPSYLLMDEATANLDMRNELEVLEMLSAYTHQTGCTAILSLHDLSTASRYADHVILLHQGKVFAEGKPAEVLNAENIREVYGVNAAVVDDNGILSVHPLSPVDEKEYHFEEKPWK